MKPIFYSIALRSQLNFSTNQKKSSYFNCLRRTKNFEEPFFQQLYPEYAWMKKNGSTENTQKKILYESDKYFFNIKVLGLIFTATELSKVWSSDVSKAKQLKLIFLISQSKELSLCHKIKFFSNFCND